MRTLAEIISILLLGVSVVACNGDDEGNSDPDTAMDSETDTGSDADTDSDTDSDSDADTDTEPGPENPWNFNMRYPQVREIACSGFDSQTETVEFMDRDWLCSFDWNGDSGMVYVQNTVSDCEWMMSQVPLFETAGAWISIDGQVTAVSEAIYDSGGNHLNDSLEFTFDGVRFRMYHSSFGFGWRACHPMDCMQVLGSGVPIIEDGCTCDRTLPVTCVAVEPEGVWLPHEDTFEVCVGDENCI